MKILKLSKYVIVVVLLLFVGLYSCNPKKRIVQSETELEEKSNADLFEDVLTKELNYSTFSSKLNVTVSTGRKVLTSRATLQIVHDNIIQLSVQPFFGIEMFRLIVKPDSILLLDRMNKRYVKESIEDCKKEYPIGFNFYTMQSLFTNSLFIHSQSKVSPKDFRSFKYMHSSTNYHLKGYDNISNIAYSFFVNGNDKVVLTKLYETSRNYSIDWNYSEFVLLNSLFFPYKMSVVASTPKRKIETSFLLSDVVVDEKVKISASIPTGYTKVDLKEILKLLAGK